MPLYMTQFSYTPEAMANMINHPEDRSKMVSDHLKQVGGELISFYFCFGDYDGFCIYNTPDRESALRIMAACWAPGFLEKVKTTEIFTVEEGISAFNKASEIDIHVPKS